MTIEQKLITAGVKNLREFGYPSCDETNILTDKIFSQFFASMLESNKGHGVDASIDALLQRIKASDVAHSKRKRAVRV